MRIIIPLALCLFLAIPIEAREINGVVVAVHDGDTITVKHGKESVKVRLADIDAPELKQPWGDKAKQGAVDLSLGKSVRVEWQHKDLYGRVDGRVYVKDGARELDLSATLVGSGLAWWYQRYSRDKRIKAIEQLARDEKRGLWADDAPVAPWEYRKKAKRK